MEASAKDLRFNSKVLLEAVARGEEVIITYHGKPHARLTAFKKKPEGSSEASELFGMWKNRDETKDVKSYVRSLRKGRKLC